MEPKLGRPDTVRVPVINWGYIKALFLVLSSVVMTAACGGGLGESSTNFVDVGGNDTDRNTITEDSPWQAITSAFIKSERDPRFFSVVDSAGGALLVQQMRTVNGVQTRFVAIDCDGDVGTDGDKHDITGILISQADYWGAPSDLQQVAEPGEFCN